MSEQLPLALAPRSTGRILAEEGMARTLDAERDVWLEDALAALRRFVQLDTWPTFKLEDFRAWAIEHGLSEPHDHHCWGAFANRAEKAGVIRFTGRFLPSVSPKTHGHPVRVWKAA